MIKTSKAIEGKFKPSSLIRNARNILPFFGKVDFETISLDLAKRIAANPQTSKYLVEVKKVSK